MMRKLIEGQLKLVSHLHLPLNVSYRSSSIHLHHQQNQRLTLTNFVQPTFLRGYLFMSNKHSFMGLSAFSVVLIII